jgi:hypothetical protein
MVPSVIKMCLNIFNEDEYLSRNNIKNHYANLIDINNYLSNNFNHEALPSKEIKLVFDEVNMKNILISSSTYNLLKSFHIFVLFFNYFNSITFDIFLQIFQNVDFYVKRMFTIRFSVLWECLHRNLSSKDFLKISTVRNWKRSPMEFSLIK